MSQAKSSLALKHEIFIFDALLEEALDQHQMQKITEDLVNDLLVALKMERLGRLEIYPAADLDYPGWSFIQPITTSHISGHYFIDTDGRHPNIHMDVYSCKNFSYKKVLSTLRSHMKIKLWSGNYIYRSLHLDERRSIAIFEDQKGEILEMIR